MAGLGAGDLWWAAAGAFIAAYAGWFAIKTRLGMTWLLNKARRGFVDWFGESIDKHVAPRFNEVRAELTAFQADTARTAAEVKADLQAQVPLVAHLEDTLTETQRVLQAHVDHDERIEAERLALRRDDAKRLIDGQGALFNRIGAQHAESMAAHDELTRKVDDHVQADAEAFARLEAKDQP